MCKDIESFSTLKELKTLYIGCKEFSQTKLTDLKASLEKELKTPWCVQKTIRGKKYKGVFVGW